MRYAANHEAIERREGKGREPSDRADRSGSKTRRPTTRAGRRPRRCRSAPGPLPCLGLRPDSGIASAAPDARVFGLCPAPCRPWRPATTCCRPGPCLVTLLTSLRTSCRDEPRADLRSIRQDPGRASHDAGRRSVPATMLSSLYRRPGTNAGIKRTNVILLHFYYASDSVYWLVPLACPSTNQSNFFDHLGRMSDTSCTSLSPRPLRQRTRFCSLGRSLASCMHA